METQQQEELAKTLSMARVEASPIEQISDSVSNFDRSDAYSIQELGIKFRQAQGEKVIGLKMGLTSEAKRQQMNLDSPLYGILTDKMQVKNRGTFSMAGTIHPKIEPEIAFLLKDDLEGKVTREDVLNACEAVCPCMEILDSRYKQFKYFSMEDVISDNSSSSHYILGDWKNDFHNVDLTNLTMEMSVNGSVAQSGNSNAISGDPVKSVMQLCELLAERGQSLKTGQFVLAGAATPAVQLEPGMEISLKVEFLGDCHVKIAE